MATSYTTMCINNAERVMLARTEFDADGKRLHSLAVEIYTAAGKHTVLLSSETPVPVFGAAYRVPYPDFCHSPQQCDGRTNCPRDPCCAD